MNLLFILSTCLALLNAQSSLGISISALQTHTSSPSTNSSLALSTLLSSLAQSKSVVTVLTSSSITNTSVSSSASSTNPVSSISVPTVTSTTNPPSSTSISITTTSIQPTSSTSSTAKPSVSQATSPPPSQPTENTEPGTTSVFTPSQTSTSTTSVASTSMGASNITQPPPVSSTGAIIAVVVVGFVILAAIAIYIFRKSMLGASLDFNRRLSRNGDRDGVSLAGIFKDDDNLNGNSSTLMRFKSNESMTGANSDVVGNEHHVRYSQPFFPTVDRFYYSNVRYQDEPLYQQNFGPGKETDQNAMIVQIPQQREQEMYHSYPQTQHDQEQAYLLPQVYESQQHIHPIEQIRQQTPDEGRPLPQPPRTRY